MALPQSPKRARRPLDKGLYAVCPARAVMGTGCRGGPGRHETAPLTSDRIVRHWAAVDVRRGATDPRPHRLAPALVPEHERHVPLVVRFPRIEQGGSAVLAVGDDRLGPAGDSDRRDLAGRPPPAPISPFLV